MATETTKTQAPKYRIKGGDSMKIPGLQLLITNANVNSEAVQQILANESKRTGRDYYKLLEKV